MNPLEYIMRLFGGGQAPASNRAQDNISQLKWGGNAFSGVPMAQAQEQSSPPPDPSMAAMAMPAPTMPPIDALRRGISNTRGADSPMLSHLDTYIQAGSQMPAGADQMLPIILALRETQGGRDLLNPDKMKGPNDGLGDNNVYNIRNDTGAFQNYPDLQTAILGNLSQGGQSGGLVGLLGGGKDSSRYIYEDWRQDPQNLAKLFAHWSPPSDSNGSLEEQVQNYNWIRNHLIENMR